MKRTHRGTCQAAVRGYESGPFNEPGTRGHGGEHRNVKYEVDADEVLYLERRTSIFCMTETSQGTEVDELWFTSLPSSSKGVLYLTMTAETNMRSKSEKTLPAET